MVILLVMLLEYLTTLYYKFRQGPCVIHESFTMGDDILGFHPHKVLFTIKMFIFKTSQFSFLQYTSLYTYSIYFSLTKTNLIHGEEGGIIDTS